MDLKSNVLARNIAFVGNALLDITCQSDDACKLAEKYNLIKQDENCEAEEWQLSLFDELMKRDDIEYTPGGSAQNSSRIARYVLNQKEENSDRNVYFIGCIGDDKNAQKLSELVKSSGVITLYDKHKTLATGITAGFVTSQTTRSLMAHVGASATFDDKFLESELVNNALKSCQIVYLEGYFLSHSPSQSLTMALDCYKNNRVFAYGLSADYIITKYYKQLMSLIPYCDIIFANKIEAITFGKELIGEKAVHEDMKEIAKLLANCDKKSHIKSMPNLMRIVMITQGEEDVIVAIKKVKDEEVWVKSYPVPPIQVTGDTIGAGDAFVGGVLSGIMLGVELDSYVRMGIDIASRVCHSRGCVLDK